jgi:hypothetical protein
MLESGLVKQAPLQQSELPKQGQPVRRAETPARETQSQTKFGQQTAAAGFANMPTAQVVLESGLVTQAPLQQSELLPPHGEPIRKEDVPGPRVPLQAVGTPDCALIAVGAITEAINGRATIEANPMRLAISRRFKPSSGLTNLSFANKLSFFNCFKANQTMFSLTFDLNVLLNF